MPFLRWNIRTHSMGRGTGGKRMWALEVIPLTLQSCDFTRFQPCHMQWFWVLIKSKEQPVKADVHQLFREGLVVILSPAVGCHCSWVLCWDTQACFGYDTCGGVWLAELCNHISVHLSWIQCFAALGYPNEDLRVDYSPLGSRRLPSMVNPPCWIAAMIWWFGLFLSYRVQSHRTWFAAGRLLKYVFAFDYISFLN